MSLITIIISIAVFGVFLYCINLLPMDGKFKQILNIIALIALLVWLMKLFGLLKYIQNITI